MRKLFFLFLFLALPIVSQAANYPLEIIQPQEELDLSSRYYKAYPGLEYNIRLAVIGGVYPYKFSLLSAPSEMTIDEDSGEISWVSPTQSEESYEISVKVIDAEKSEQIVTWPLIVTTSGFRFIDSVNGILASDGGTGTIDNPWRSMVDMYEGTDYDAKYARSYAGEFLYYREGTYYTSDAFQEDEGRRMPVVGDFKPQVWLAYPGESPNIDLGGGYISIYGGGSNTYFDGLNISINGNERGFAITIDSNVNNITFRKNKFDANNYPGVIGGNNSLVNISRAGVGNYWSFQDNIASNMAGEGGYWLLAYDARNVLVEDNTISNITGHSIGPKEGTNMWFIRKNIIHSNSGDGIGVQYSSTNGINSGNIEISHNYIYAPEAWSAIYLNGSRAAVGDPIYVFRNTLVGSIRLREVTSTNGPFYFDNNIIVNDVEGDEIISEYVSDESRIISGDNLMGTVSDAIIDSNGNLTEDYENYLGTYGWQVDGVETTTQTVIRADVNQDSQINLKDTLLTLRNSLGLDMDSAAWQESDNTGDVNCDGYSNMSDVLLLLRYSLGFSIGGTSWCE